MTVHKDKVALVTGGGTGVGRATCIKLADHGASVILNYSHSYKEAQETVEMIEASGGSVIAIKADVTDDCAVQKMIKEAERKFGAIHYLINNASITEQIDLADLESVTDNVWEKLFSVNVKGMFYCARAVAPIMKSKRIVLLSTWGVLQV